MRRNQVLPLHGHPHVDLVEGQANLLGEHALQAQTRARPLVESQLWEVWFEIKANGCHSVKWSVDNIY